MYLDDAEEYQAALAEEREERERERQAAELREVMREGKLGGGIPVGMGVAEVEVVVGEVAVSAEGEMGGD
ncbi:hypothetical protein HDU67_009160 [Dinochytrium kinnereticum]|nr:hypothetical protein HDU67_009160 [Dinochytrium kinnereticum]